MPKPSAYLYVCSKLAMEELRSQEASILQLDFHFTTFHISESEDQILNNSATRPNYTALFDEAVLLARLYFRKHGTVRDAIQAQVWSFEYWSNIKLCIPHFVIKIECVPVINILHITMKEKNVNTRELINSVLIEFSKTKLNYSNIWHIQHMGDDIFCQSFSIKFRFFLPSLLKIRLCCVLVFE